MTVITHFPPNTKGKCWLSGGLRGVLTEEASWDLTQENTQGHTEASGERIPMRWQSTLEDVLSAVQHTIIHVWDMRAAAGGGGGVWGQAEKHEIALARSKIDFQHIPLSASRPGPSLQKPWNDIQRRITRSFTVRQDEAVKQRRCVPWFVQPITNGRTVNSNRFGDILRDTM